MDSDILKGRIITPAIVKMEIIQMKTTQDTKITPAEFA
jgi:hypothetical protein